MIRAIAPLLISALLGVVALAGCQDPAPAGPCTCGEAQPVDPALLAYLSRARALHHEADMAEGAKDLPRATAAIERLIGGPSPGAHKEVNEVLADAHARLAELRASAGDAEGALRAVDQGLLKAPEATYFRGHLFEVRGVLGERQAAELAARGEAAAAASLRKRALDDSDEAVKIQEEVIRQTLTKGGK
jgi:tetratricopeptide (TPR) repeat protein